MPLCVNVDVNNNLVSSNSSVLDCTSYVLVDSNEYQLMLNTYDITPIDIASSFTWGFSTYIFFWWLGFVIKSAKQVIRKA